MDDENPEARRARRLAEARAQRGTPERQAQVDAMLQAKAASDTAATQQATRPARARSAPGTRAPRAPRTPRQAPDPSTRQPGHALPVWIQMRTVALAHLEACARAGELTSPDAVWQVVKDSRTEELGNPRYQLPKLLGYVETKSLADTGLLASALIVQPDRGNEPSAEFFRLAHKRGLISDDDAPPATDAGWTMSEAQREFWQSQVDAMFERFG